jgi:plasmid stability protein
MAQLLIRQLDETTVQRLKERAKRHGRSLEAELRIVLQEAVADPQEEMLKLRQAFGGRRFPDSSEVLRQP